MGFHQIQNRFLSRRRQRAAEQRWCDLLESAMCSLLEYEMDESRIRRAVQKSAIAADEALAEFSARWTR